MRRLCATILLILGCIVIASYAEGHFHTYLPPTDNGYARPGQPVRWDYFWGHPYEMVVFDAERPTVYAWPPSGEREEVVVESSEVTDPLTGDQRRGYIFTYAPRELGDTWLVLEAPPYAVEEEGLIWQDYLKQCVHVLAESGWDSRIGLPIELVPLTRPYGIEAGFAFTARAYLHGAPLPNATVEIEKYNGFHVPEDALPRDQFGTEDVPMITRTAKTDVNGYVTHTLDEPGWWVIAVEAENGVVTHEGEQYPRVLRGCLWVPVQPATALSK